LTLGYPRNIKKKPVNIFTESLGVQVQVNIVALLMLYYITFASLLLVVSEMTYTVSSGTLNSSIPYHSLLLGRENMAFITLVEF